MRRFLEAADRSPDQQASALNPPVSADIRLADDASLTLYALNVFCWTRAFEPVIFLQRVRDELRRRGVRMQDFKVAGFPFKANPQMFSGSFSPAEQKALFKAAVSRVVLETSSYCNRQCVFCPNVAGMRLGKAMMNKSMPKELMVSIIKALASIDYDKTILLHLYNEPMADPELASKIAIIRDLLPKASISFNSNGDYLSRDAVDRMAKAGLSSFSISLYGPNHGEWKPDYLEKAFERVFKIIGVRSDVKRVGDTELRAKVSYEADGKVMPIRVFAIDFNRVGYDRANSVEVGVETVRTSPCPAPFAEMNIAWDGHVVPCCNIHPDIAADDGHMIGKIERGDDIFALFAGQSMQQWRKSLALYGAHRSPCDSCTRLNEPEEGASEKAQAHNEQMLKLLNA